MDTLENHMAEYEEAINKLKENEKEIARLKSDLAENEEKLNRALKCKADLRELKKRLRESELAISLQKEETEQVRKDLDEERHEHRMAQVRAQERGRKIQLLNLELTELKESFEIARNAIDEKETNMKGIKKRLEAEREQKLKLEKKLEIMSHLETKLKYVEEEKHRLERLLKDTKLKLKDKQELDQSTLEQENKRLKDQLKETEDRITSLNIRILQMDQETGDNRKSIERLESHSDELKLRYWDLWHSCQYDREWWMQRSLKVGCDSGRRCKRAPARRPRRGYQSGGMRSSYRGHLTELPGGNIDHHADDEGLASCAVRNGDRVMIQNKINGEEKTTKGTVRYVAVGANGLTLLMALELD